MKKTNSLNKGSLVLNSIMNKKGIVIEAGAVILILLTTVGIYAVAHYNSTPIYIGDKITHHYFDYFKCKELTLNITEQNMVIFYTKDEANQAGFNETKGCV